MTLKHRHAHCIAYKANYDQVLPTYDVYAANKLRDLVTLTFWTSSLINCSAKFFSELYVSYTIVWSGIYEWNEYIPLQTMV